MADISTANSADLQLAATANQEVWKLLSDNVDLGSTCYMAKDPAGSGSEVVSIHQTQFDEVMAAPGEGSEVSDSTLGDGIANLTVARYAVRYDVTDLFQITVAPGVLDRAALVEGIVGSVRRTRSALICDAIDGFTLTDGDAAAALTVDDCYSAQAQLIQAGVDAGRVFLVLRGKQFTDLQASIRGEGGAVSYDPSTRDITMMKGQGFKGNFNGWEIWTSEQVNTSGGGYDGAMYAFGAVACSEASAGAVASYVAPSDFLSVAVNGAPVWIEIERSGSFGLTKVIGNYFPGIGINENGLGVTISSVT